MSLHRSIPKWTALLLLALVLAPGATARKKDPKRTSLKGWMDGPIRYIARKHEMKQFKTLDNDQQRAVFIEKFWNRRDPTSDTMLNEYRHMFWLRVREANDNFTDSTKRGCMTDRGKIHILYGPPTEVQEEFDLETRGLPTGGKGLIRWIYEGRPGQRMDLDPITVVPFVRDASGEYRISYDPQLASVFFDANAIREQLSHNSGSSFLYQTATPNTSQLSVMLDLGKLQEVPPQELVLLERVETSESYDTDPLEVGLSRYLDSEERRTVAVVTVALGEIETKPALIARFAPLDATRETRVLGEDSFRLADAEDGSRVAQARIHIDPGDYILTVLSADPVRIVTSLYRGPLSIPADSERLRFSDLVWAEQLASLDYASLASHTEPFIVGPFRVIPKLDNRFRAGDPLRLFYEIYQAAFPVTVSYQLQGQDEGGAWVRLGQPQVAEQSAAAQGWELPTSERWPSGAYRVQIEVQDAEGRLISTTASFELVSPDPS